MPLTDLAIRGFKPAEKPYKKSDGGGLQLRVMPSGSKLWVLMYRNAKGIQRKLSFGAYPTVTLEKARAKRSEAKTLLADGIDPFDHEKAAKAHKLDSEAHTFASVAAELLAKKKREGKASNTIGKREWLYSLAGDAFGRRPIAGITPPEVLKVLQAVESTGRLETARRMRSSIGEVFRFAVATGRATNDPTFALRGALAKPQVKHRAAILEPARFGELLRAVDGFRGQPETVAALKLMALVYQRPGELRKAEWREFDLDKAFWSIPASRMKMRRDQRVPLARQAVTILRELHTITGRGDLVFPGIVSARKPISENTLNIALRRMGFGADEMTSHGFRATASTILNESGLFSADAIEIAQSRKDKNAVRAIYSRSDFFEERQRMAQWWADYLDELRIDKKDNSEGRMR
ncbi:MAG: integrase arm-type DNA-binding domain-containing protein [Beijerinckiaceae bacterium]|nr:integrase arm-type DNA-binding domain-containing protein [Beijerinckiaceae bacterium]MCZ8299466.1 integrase arm-type DNA-binding domain-containing protein [Beijerinckiaceae bacterium]